MGQEDEGNILDYQVAPATGTNLSGHLGVRVKGTAN